MMRHSNRHRTKRIRSRNRSSSKGSDTSSTKVADSHRQSPTPNIFDCLFAGVNCLLNSCEIHPTSNLRNDTARRADDKKEIYRNEIFDQESKSILKKDESSKCPPSLKNGTKKENNNLQFKIETHENEPPKSKHHLGSISSILKIRGILKKELLAIRENTVENQSENDKFINIEKDKIISTGMEELDVCSTESAKSDMQNSSIFTKEAGEKLRENFPKMDGRFSRENAINQFNLEEAFLFVASGYFELTSKQIEVGKRFANGAFAQVHKGFLFPEKGTNNQTKESSGEGRRVAVKIQPVPESSIEQANMLGELAILRALCKSEENERLVKYFGTALIYEKNTHQIMMVMELCRNGALREALRKNLSWPLRIRIACDVAQGLQTLHDYGIIHRDVKTTNVLLDSHWKAKLCDFNLAIDDESAAKLTHVAGTTEFMSPEALLCSDFTFSSDMFGFGITLFEVITVKIPGTDGFLERHPRDLFMVDVDEIENQRPDDVPPSFWRLALDCCDKEAEIRPSAIEAIDWLDDLLREYDNVSLTEELEIAAGQRKNSLGSLSIESSGSGSSNNTQNKVKKREGQRLDGDILAETFRHQALKSLDEEDFQRLIRMVSVSPTHPRSFAHAKPIRCSTSSAASARLAASKGWIQSDDEGSIDYSSDSSDEKEKVFIRKPMAKSAPNRSSLMFMIKKMKNERLSLVGKRSLERLSSIKDNLDDQINANQYHNDVIARVQGLGNTNDICSNLKALRDPMEAITSTMKDCANALHRLCKDQSIDLASDCEEDESSASDSEESVRRCSSDDSNDSTSISKRFKKLSLTLNAAPKKILNGSDSCSMELSEYAEKLSLLIEKLALKESNSKRRLKFILNCELAVEALEKAEVAWKADDKVEFNESHKVFCKNFQEAKKFSKKSSFKL